MDIYLTQFTLWVAAYAPRVVMALLTLFIGFWIANKISQILSAALRRRKVEETVIPFLASIITVVLKVVVLISVAGMFGIETTSFIALVGAVSSPDASRQLTGRGLKTGVAQHNARADCPPAASSLSA